MSPKLERIIRKNNAIFLIYSQKRYKMANNNSTTRRGNYICKVGDLDIYQKTIHETSGKGKSDVTNLKIKSRELSIYHAKKLVLGGFKTKDLAIEKATEIMEGGIKAIKDLKKGKK